MKGRPLREHPAWGEAVDALRAMLAEYQARWPEEYFVDIGATVLPLEVPAADLPRLLEQLGAIYIALRSERKARQRGLRLVEGGAR